MAYGIDPLGIDPFSAAAAFNAAGQQFMAGPDNPLYDEEADRLIARAVSLVMAGTVGLINTEELGMACLAGAAMAVYLTKNGDVDL